MPRHLDLSRLPLPGQILLLGLLYYILAHFSLLLAFAGSNASPVWPPAGLALAALMLGGTRLWPAILFGAFAANLDSFLAQEQSSMATYAISLTIALGNTSAAITGAWLLKRRTGTSVEQPLLNTMPGCLKFILVVMLVSAVSASIGLASTLAGQVISADMASTVGLTWWMGDLSGILILSPFLIAWFRPATAHKAIVAGRLWQPVSALVGIALLAWLLFAAPFGGADSARPWLFLLLPALAAITLRWGLRGATSANLMIATLAVGISRLDLGLFSQSQLNDALIQCDLLLCLFSVLALLIAVDLAENQKLNKQSSLWQKTGWPWLGLFIGLTLTVLAWHLVSRNSERRFDNAFQRQADAIQKRLSGRLADYQSVLHGASVLFQVKDKVSRQDWRTYYQTVEFTERFPGIQGLGFALWLAPQDVRAHSERLRAEGFPTYALHPSSQRNEYTSIIYLEPFDQRNQRAFGFDMFTETTRQQAMILARDSGKPTASGKVTLRQEDSEQAQNGFLFYLPVYRSGMPNSTPAERRRALLGYVYSPFRMDDLIKGTLSEEIQNITLEIFDGESRLAESRLFSNAAESLTLRQLRLERRLDIGQHEWVLQLTTRPAFFAARDAHQASLVLLFGILLSLALFALVRSLAITQRQAEAMAARMSQAFIDAELRLNALVDSAHEGILVTDGQGNIVSANPAAHALFAHSSQNLSGHTLFALLGPNDGERLQSSMAALLQAKEQHTERLSLNGLRHNTESFPISLSLSTWHSTAGEMFGLIVRDTTELQHADEFMRGVFDQGADPMLVASPQGRILRANEAACKRFGYSQSRLLELGIEDLIPTRFRSRHVTDRSHFSSGNERRAMGVGRRLFALCADGSEFPVDVTLSTLLLPSGKQIVTTVIDISERLHAEQRIQELLSLQTAILTSANFSIITTTPQGTILSFNRAAERMLGYTADEMVGQQTPAILHDEAEILQRAPELSAEQGESIAPGFEVFVAKARHGAIEEREWTYIRKDGSRLPVSLSVTALYDETGAITGFMGIASDITERQRAANALRDSAHFLRLMADNIPAAIGYWSRELRCTFANAHYLEWYGLTPQIVFDTPLPELLGEEVFAQSLPYLEAALRGKTQHFERRMTMANGTVADTWVNYIPDQTNGQVRGFFVLISELKKTEQTLRESEGMLRGLFELSPLGIALTDMNGGYVEFNESFRNICGYPSDELYSLDYWALTPREYEAADALQVENLERDGRYGPYEKEYLQKTGQRISVRLNGVKMTLQGADYTWSIVEDISLQKAAAVAVFAAKQAAESSNRAKGDFLANMSHEIRTPLNAVLGLTQLLLESELNERQQDFLHKIHTSSQSLLAILNDILDYSKIEAGRLELEMREFNLRHLLEACIGIFSAQAEQKSVDLRFELPAELPHHIVGDSLRLSQVLNNLIGNALKFTENGSIKVTVRQLETSASDLCLEFVVRDTGIGIDAGKIDQLFQAFTQADSSVTRKHGGTGLGLAISRRLVELMGGQISVDGIVGEGSCFRFNAHFLLAADKLTANETPHRQNLKSRYREQAEPIKGARLLVVEDNELNRTVACELLSRAGLDVTLANDGLEAIERARGTPFAAILMDLQMPGIDGLEATRRLRELPEHRQTPILAMTAAAMLQDREACLAVGMNDHLSKPIHPEQLIQTLLKWIPPTATGIETRAQRRPTSIPDSASLEKTLARALPEIAVEEAIKRTGGNTQLYVQLLRAYAPGHRALLDELHSPVSIPPDKLYQLAHALKGESANLGMQTLAAAADVLAQAARHGETDKLPSLRENLANTLERTMLQVSTLDTLMAAEAPVALDWATLPEELEQLEEHLCENRLKGKRMTEEIAAKLAGGPLANAFRPTLEAALNMNFKDARQALIHFRATLKESTR